MAMTLINKSMYHELRGQTVNQITLKINVLSAFSRTVNIPPLITKGVPDHPGVPEIS